MNMKEVKKIREQTGVGYMVAKDAYVKAGGDYDKALSEVKNMGLIIAEKRRAKITNNSTIGYYAHSKQRIVSIVELCCESKYTASADYFIKFANDIATHIAAAPPKYLSKKEVPKEIIDNIHNTYIYEMDNNNISEKSLDKKIKNRAQEYYEENCLLEQKYIRDLNKSIHDLIMEFIYLHKENIMIRRFNWYKAGEIL